MTIRNAGWPSSASAKTASTASRLPHGVWSRKPNSSSAASAISPCADDIRRTSGWPGRRRSTDAIPGIMARRGRRVCVLASGDPFFYGVGATLMRAFRCRRDGLHSRAVGLQPCGLAAGLGVAGLRAGIAARAPFERIVPLLQPGARILALSWDETTPAHAGRPPHRARHGPLAPRRAAKRMGGPRERVRTRTAAGLRLAGRSIRSTPSRWRSWPTGARSCCRSRSGLPDDLFEHDGQITKREIRAVTLSALAPRQGELLWDIGAGSGSVGIEWMLRHPANRAIAIEARADRAARAARNAASLGVPDLRIVEGSRTGRAGRPAAARRDLRRWRRHAIPPSSMRPGPALRPGGRLVVNAVTLETQAELMRRHVDLGGELVSMQIARADSGRSPSRLAGRHAHHAMVDREAGMSRRRSTSLAIGIGCRAGCPADSIAALVAPGARQGGRRRGGAVHQRRQADRTRHPRKPRIALRHAARLPAARRPRSRCRRARRRGPSAWSRCSACRPSPKPRRWPAPGPLAPGRAAHRRCRRDLRHRRAPCRPSSQERLMTVHFIGAGPGAPDLITVRGRDLVARCPVCLYAGSLVPREIARALPARRAHRRYRAAVARRHHGRIRARRTRRARTWRGCIPATSRSGARWASSSGVLDARGIPYTITPGVPSFAAAAAALGRELTLPEVAQSVVLTRTSGRASSMPPRETLAAFAATRRDAGHPSVGPCARRASWTSSTPHYGADCPVAIVYRACWPDERVVRGTLADHRGAGRRQARWSARR